MSTSTTLTDLAKPTLIQPPVKDALTPQSGSAFSSTWTGWFTDTSLLLSNVAQQLNTIWTGVTDGSDAAPGQIGEYMQAVSGSVALSSGVQGNVISLDLTAGDWDVFGNVQFNVATGNHYYFGAGVEGVDTWTSATYPAAALNEGISTSLRRVSTSAASTVWLVALVNSTAASITAVGSIRARRMR